MPTSAFSFQVAQYMYFQIFQYMQVFFCIKLEQLEFDMMFL